MTLAFAGLVFGAVHVLSGPDHLSAIAPFAVADGAGSWRTGVRWGLGHSGGVLGVGLLALLARNALPIEALSAHGEVAVGITLVGIGSWGFRAALRTDSGGRSIHGHPHAHGQAALAVGTLHGLAGSSHLLGILPALALPSNGAAAAYLLCFCIGSVAAMGAFASLIGWVAGRSRDTRASAQRTLLCLCSAIAVLVGGWWLLESLKAAPPLSAVASGEPLGVGG
jgi:hypothetical protein